jgi:HK97 family phage portal protein
VGAMGLITDFQKWRKSNKETEQRGITSFSGVPANYSDFATTLSSWFGLFDNKANVPVTPESSLTLSAFYECVNAISEDIAKLPFDVLLKKEGNFYPLPNNPASVLFSIRPNNFSTPITFTQTLLKSALIRGNGYAYVERDENAKPIALYWLRDEAVSPYLKGRKMFYIVNDTTAEISGTFTSDDILHIRGMGDGYIGKSVVGYASESIGKAIATQQFGAKFFGKGGFNLLLKYAGIKDEAKLKQAKESFIRSYELDGVAATANGVEVEKIAIPNNEAQFIESQDFNVSDIARWFRMPLYKLQKDTSAPAESQEISYVNDCLMPWIIRLEQEIRAKLLTEQQKYFLVPHFDTFMLLKGDSQAQERRAKTMFMIGALTPNEGRRMFDFNTIEQEELSKTYLPANMLPSDQVQEFWAGKVADPSKVDLSSVDTSGSGNSNNNIK